MRDFRRPAGSGLLLLAAAVSLAAFQTSHALAEEPLPRFGQPWLDIDGRPLPFQDHATARDALRAARVLSRETIERGVTRPEKIVLEHEGTRFHAAFRTVDVTARAQPAGGVSARKRPTSYRDAAVFECGAYEISQLLGIGRVPPTVVRRLEGVTGTLQIWVEETMPEIELAERGLLRPPDPARWNQQKQIMYVFDSLIANRDRNQGNLLINRSWDLWLIDHTRAFTQTSRLPNRDRLERCERRLWMSLRAVDENELRERLQPYLTERELSTVVKRWRKLVDHFEKLIQKRGEGAVLFDLRPPGAEEADWSDPQAQPDP